MFQPKYHLPACAIVTVNSCPVAGCYLLYDVALQQRGGEGVNVEECYTELGLRADCSDAELKAAWRRLAARWHPDRNGSPQALRKIQRINRALEEIRKAREAGGDPEQPARTVDHSVRVTLEEALAGCSRELQGTLEDACAACDGSGLQAHATACPACEGEGQLRQPLWFGWIASTVACKACAGQGASREACLACEGSGKAAPRRYRTELEIPAGTLPGTLLELPTWLQGAEGGEVLLRVRVELEPHPFFTLEEDGTVKLELPVDGFAWIAHRWIDVPTPDGLQQMRLRRDFLVYRIKGRGFPKPDGEGRADCIVTVTPLFPDELSDAQDALLDRLMASNSRASGTPANQQVRAWERQVKQWQKEARAGA